MQNQFLSGQASQIVDLDELSLARKVDKTDANLYKTSEDHLSSSCLLSSYPFFVNTKEASLV